MTDYSSVVEPLLRSFRPEILKYFGNVEHGLKSDKSVVTELDKSIEKRIREELEKHFPNIGFEGEEYGKSGNTNVYWLIDPIDGTESFIRGIPGVSTIVGLVEDGECTFSAIYDPTDDIIYSAKKGKGVHANGKKAGAHNREVSQSMVDLRGNSAAKNFEVEVVLEKIGVGNVSRFYGSGIRSAYFARGGIDGFIYVDHKGNDWDHVPTKMLAIEAGGLYVEFDGLGFDSRTYAILSTQLNEKVGDQLMRLLS